MDAQKKAELRCHLNGIAAILHAEVDPAELTTLESIERNVRNLAQEHVLPQLGIFYRLRNQQQRWEAANHKLKN